MIAISLNTPIPSNHQLVFICTSSRCVSCLLVPDLAMFGGILWRFLFFGVGIVVVSTFAMGLVTSCLVVSLFLSCLVLSAIQPVSQPASQLAKQSASQPACQPACQPSNQAAVAPRCINHRMALAGACGKPECRSTCFSNRIPYILLVQRGRLLRSRRMALAGVAVSLSSEMLVLQWNSLHFSCPKGSLPASQPGSQAGSHPAIQPASQPASQPACQTVSQPTSLPASLPAEPNMTSNKS
jgi:hypothetical protein